MRKNNLQYRLLIENLILALRLNFNVFPFLCVTGFALTILESFTYPGFIGKHLYINVEFLAVGIFFSGIMAGLTFISEKGGIENRINTDIYFFLKNLCLISIFPAIIFLYILDNFLPANRDSIILNNNNLLFPGRVIVSFGFILFFMSIYYVFISFYKTKQMLLVRNYLTNGNFQENLMTIAFYATIFLIIIYSIKMDLPILKYDIKFIAKNFNYSYEQKMGALVGPNYYYYVFIKENTPDDAVILKPKQQGRWPDLSNEGYSRYFLYPRKFVSEEDAKEIKDKATHSFLVGNIKLINTEKLDRWPDFDIAAKEVVLYSPEKHNVFTSVSGGYTYKTFKYPEKWGLIVLDKAK